MNFKHWLILSETIDANTKNLLAKAKAPKDELDAFIKELEDEPTIIDNKTAFQRFQAKFLTNKEKPKDEDAQRKHFATIPNTTEEELQTYDYYKTENKESLRQMMEQLRNFIDKKLITLKIENNIPVIYRNTTQGSNKLDTPDFGRFTSQLDSIQGEITKYSGKGNKPNPIELELNHAEHLVAKGDNIWVFKGHRPNICRILGKNQIWCISLSTSAAHWFSYRISHHQTQYFVFDFNKDEDDPARYVNPGVAPEGMYSEWVDAKNNHSPDPDARGDRSHVGINGYSSINEYKKYLESKGIPLTTWTTTTPEDWEKRLYQYYLWNRSYTEEKSNSISFASAKNDKHPEVFDMYLKIVNTINDSDFDTLTDDQKREFLLNKITNITQKQFTYAIENFKGDYYNSLDLDGKIQFAFKTNDQDKILNFIKKPELSDENVNKLLSYSDDKNKMAEIIIQNKPELSDNNVQYLLHLGSEKDEIAKLIIEKKPELSDNDVANLLGDSIEKDEIAKLIIEKKPELSSFTIFHFVRRAIEKDEIVKLLQEKTDNISKLNINQIEHLINMAKNKDEIIKIFIKYKPELSDRNVYYFLFYAKNREKIAELLQKKTDNISKLTDDNVKNLLLRSKYKRAGKYKEKDTDNKIEIIIKYKKYLSHNNVYYLLLFSKIDAFSLYRNKIAKLIIDKEPELRYIVNKYLSELKNESPR